jgi:serine/threonine protein kinase
LAIKREIAAMKSLQSPFICQLYEVFMYEGHVYLAIEYADGGDLEKNLNDM